METFRRFFLLMGGDWWIFVLTKRGLVTGLKNVENIGCFLQVWRGWRYIRVL